VETRNQIIPVSSSAAGKNVLLHFPFSLNICIFSHSLLSLDVILHSSNFLNPTLRFPKDSPLDLPSTPPSRYLPSLLLLGFIFFSYAHTLLNDHRVSLFPSLQEKGGISPKKVAPFITFVLGNHTFLKLL